MYWFRPLTQAPAEQIHETVKTECLNSLVALCMQIEKRFPLEGEFVTNLGISDSVAAEDLSKNSITNAALHFTHQVPDDQLEAISTV